MRVCTLARDSHICGVFEKMPSFLALRPTRYFDIANLFRSPTYSPWGIPITIMHKQSIACDPEDVLSLDFEVVDGLGCVLWLDATHRGGTGKRR